MALKKEPKAGSKKALAGEDDSGAAKAVAKKAATKPKAAKKASAKGGKSESQTESLNDIERADAKHHKILARGRTGKRDSVEVELDPFEVARQSVKGSVPAIVEAMVEKAKQGSCAHAKTLLEMAGAKHLFEGEAENSEPWAKLVLERLDEAESKGETEGADLHVGARES